SARQAGTARVRTPAGAASGMRSAAPASEGAEEDDAHVAAASFTFDRGAEPAAHRDLRQRAPERGELERGLPAGDALVARPEVVLALDPSLLQAELHAQRLCHREAAGDASHEAAIEVYARAVEPVDPRGPEIAQLEAREAVEAASVEPLQE